MKRHMSGSKFTLHLRQIQPSQLYISRSKLERVLDHFRSGNIDGIEPVPIKTLDGEYVSTDGHTRMFAWFINGVLEIPVIWEDEELSWEEYRVCVKWCKDEGITWIGDLNDRVVSDSEYQKLWYDRCDVLHREMRADK